MTTAAEAIGLPPAEAIRFFGGKANVGTRRWDDVWKAAHTRAFMVAGVQAEDVLGGVRAALDKAIREGTTLREFRADLGPLMQRLGWEAKGKGYVAWRTRLVYETNLRSAYAAGQYEQQTDPDVLALVPIWRYRHSGARDPRPEHVRWDGLTLRHDDAWWATHYPPNGWGCGCWVEPLTERQAARGAGTAGRDAAGLNQAPEILRRQWTDPVSGRTEQVPIGIDPGWDYNVGAAWRSARDLPEPPVPIPPGFAPPTPALPAPAPAAARLTRRQPAADAGNVRRTIASPSPTTPETFRTTSEVREAASRIEATLTGEGFHVRRSDSWTPAGGASTYLEVSDPTTGLFLSGRIRVSDHSVGTFRLMTDGDFHVRGDADIAPALAFARGLRSAERVARVEAARAAAAAEARARQEQAEARRQAQQAAEAAAGAEWRAVAEAYPQEWRDQVENAVNATRRERARRDLRARYRQEGGAS